MSSDGRTGYVSLWNASTVAQLDLAEGRVTKKIALSKPRSDIEAGSHPTAMVLSQDNKRLYVALANADEVDAVDCRTGEVIAHLSTKLPGQRYGGSDPNALAISADEQRLYAANAISDSVAVFDLTKLEANDKQNPVGFIPTEWYPTALGVTRDELLVASAKGKGSGPATKLRKGYAGPYPKYEYIPALTHGSIARVPLRELDSQLASYTRQVAETNAARGNTDRIRFASDTNPVKHVIYIIKENRTFDQILGDLGAGDGDRSLTMYGEEITPNEHQLARQFGVLDNFYDSGDVSGDGHMWSTSATVSDYVAKNWPIGYRGKERTYDSEGQLLHEIPLEEGIPDVGESQTGFLWRNFARHGITYRHYGEFIVSRWCHRKTEGSTGGPPQLEGRSCLRSVIEKGQPLEPNVGDPHGSPSPYPWPIPVLADNTAAKVDLRGHFDPHFPDFQLEFPDQLRVDEFLNEFNAFVHSRQGGNDTMPQFILLRLPNDHTAGGQKGMPTPSASIADNDLAVGRVVEAISHSPYWDDTAIMILEDDAQDGPDHVDGHRSIAFVISKYSPAPRKTATGLTPFVDHTFYTTINMVRTIEALLGAPPMNVNDARAALLAPLFSGDGSQAPFRADYRNRDNGLLYKTNPQEWKEGANLDFSHADAADTTVLNRFLWKERMGAVPMPKIQHQVFPEADVD
jgi:DNA-binding beta-propeller fold protein YncE